MMSEYKGHQKMIVWQEADKLDIMVQEILKKIPRNEFKLREQIDSASDSIGSNFVEGYYSGSTKEYLRFNRYARRSCGELQERIRRACRKELVSEEKFNACNNQCAKVGYLFDRLINSLQNKISNTK